MTSTQNLKTQLDFFYQWEKETPNNVFLKQPKGDSWKEITYKEAGQIARKLVAALQAKGLQKGDHIGLMSKNCYHWVITDLAISMGGFVSVPYYTSLPKDALAHVIEKSDLKLLFIGKLDKWEDRSEAIPEDLPVIKYPHYEGNAEIPIGESWNDFIAQHEAVTTNYVPALDDLWSIFFTSGTTGTPKGVMHTYHNLAHIIQSEKDNGLIGITDNIDYVFISYLPLNHVAERTGVFGLCMLTGGTIGFVESVDTFAKNIQDLQPTFFIGVPTIWTKFRGGVLAKLSQKKLNLLLKIPIVSSIVKKKLKTALGLSRATQTMTVAAIAPVHLKQWFDRLGIHMREVYGSTEGCGIVTITPRGESNLNGVGKPIAGFEMKIDPETSEIIYRSPQLMTGYYKDEEKTAEVLKDGWFYSGDKGRLDENGYLHIIGRVKDAFKTDKGIYVVPNIIEEPLSKHEFIENICVVGLGCSHPLALINLSESGLATSKKEVTDAMDKHLNHVNKKLKSNEKIRTLIITKDLWDVDNELLTPTFKVRRNQIDDYYRDQYQDWDQSDEHIIWES